MRCVFTAPSYVCLVDHCKDAAHAYPHFRKHCKHLPDCGSRPRRRQLKSADLNLAVADAQAVHPQGSRRVATGGSAPHGGAEERTVRVFQRFAFIAIGG